MRKSNCGLAFPDGRREMLNSLLGLSWKLIIVWNLPARRSRFGTGGEIGDWSFVRRNFIFF
jgi:hypothetical protein